MDRRKGEPKWGKSSLLHKSIRAMHNEKISISKVVFLYLKAIIMHLSEIHQQILTIKLMCYIIMFW